MTEPVIACVGAACVGKKFLLAIPFLGVGLGVVAAKVSGTLSVDVIKDWSVVAAALATAFYVGSMAMSVEKQNEINDLQHASLKLKIETAVDRIEREAELYNEDRDSKLDFVYNRAIKGNRYTWDNAQLDKKIVLGKINENSTEDNVRHETVLDAILVLAKRVTRSFEKIDKINTELKIGDEE